MSHCEANLVRERAFRVTGRMGEVGVEQTENLLTQVSESVVLHIDEGKPGEMKMGGKRIALQDKQFRLMMLLATRTGTCVPYEDIYEHLWADTIVENNQSHFQKRKLKKAIESSCAEYGDLIKTVPKRGFMLQLEPYEVEIGSWGGEFTQMALNVGNAPGSLVNSSL